MRRPLNLAAVVGFLCLFPPALTAHAATYYVAPDGDDGASGGAGAPWATPGPASRRLAPGDTLIIRGGRYQLNEYPDHILTPPSGDAGAWITIRGESGNRPVLAGAENLAMAVNLSGRQYVRLENLEITSDNSALFRDGVVVAGEPAAHLVFKDLYIHHLDEFGLNLQDVDDLVVEDSRIEYCGFGAAGGPDGDEGGWRNVLFRRTHLSYSGHYYQGSNGDERPYDRPDGLGSEESEGPLLIEDCVAAHNRGDGLDSKTRNTTIRRSMVANNSCDGVKLWGGDSRVESTLIYGRGDGDPQITPWAAIVISGREGDRFELINLSVDDQLGGNYLMHVNYDLPEIGITVLMRNNIFRAVGGSSALWLAPAASLEADHNLFFLPGSSEVIEHGDVFYNEANLGDLGPGNIYGEPLFLRPAWGEEGDYRLQQSSPALGAGVSQGAPATDLAGRAYGHPPSLGAYER
jgi:hypothetical protein